MALRSELVCGCAIVLSIAHSLVRFVSSLSVQSRCIQVMLDIVVVRTAWRQAGRVTLVFESISVRLRGKEITD